MQSGKRKSNKKAAVSVGSTNNGEVEEKNAITLFLTSYHIKNGGRNQA